MPFVKLIMIIWQNLFLVFVGLVGIGSLIAFHELGHFLFCKLFKIRTPSFSIGFGPRLISKKIGDTLFSISAIPLGGYVEIAGAAEVGQGEQKEALARDEHSFATKPFWQKFLVMSGGILFNMIFAYVIMILVCMAGLPNSPLAQPYNSIPTINKIAPNSPAQKAGLEKGDTIIAINNKKIGMNVNMLLSTIKPLANKKVTLLIKRSGEEKNINVTLSERTMLDKKIGTLGVGFEYSSKALSFIQAVKQGAQMVHDRMFEIFHVFKYMFTKRDASQVAGPLAIISLTMTGAAKGLKILLILLAIISINLAVLNVLPIPIFDGGQILFYGIEALIGKPLPERIREYIHIATWLLMITLFVYLSAKDIARIASPYIEHITKFIGWTS